MFYPPPKSHWYKQPWFLGMLLGNFAGLLLLCGGNSSARRFLESAFPYTAFGYYTGDFLYFMGLFLNALIFPAFLTCVAKQFYALWSLLPIFLLFLWLTVGNSVSHTLSSFFDPIWDIPIAVLLCWVISSLPLSLFRFLRQRHRRTVAVAPNPVPRRQVSRWYGFAAFLMPLLGLATLGWYNLTHPLHFDVELKAQWSSGKEVRIPLMKESHRLFVKVWLNDIEEL